MGIKLLTVLERNSDTSYAGSVLFNSNRMSNMQVNGSADTFFEYGLNTNDVVFDKYIVDEAIATADDVFAAVSSTFYLLPIHDDVNDSSSDTTNKVIDPDDIAKGIALPSDDTKSLLFVQNGGKVEKVLVNKALETIEDYVMTGTTTSTTTSTSSSTTSSTSSTTTP